MFVKLVFALLVSQAPSVDELVRDAKTARGQQDVEKAYALLAQAITAYPKSPLPYIVRAGWAEADDRLTDAIADWTKIIELDSTDSGARQSRGIVNLKAGNAAAAVADFDAFLAKNPREAKGHWQRGIACYYAGKFAEGQRQFESYQDFDNADIENALWRFMCMTKSDGLEKAKAAMLKIGDDRRVPMRDIYEMYLGRKTPDEVVEAATAGGVTNEVKNRQLFYAHLYLGIWFDLTGETKKALDHLNRAVEHRINHTMWDVARVHRDHVKSAKK